MTQIVVTGAKTGIGEAVVLAVGGALLATDYVGPDIRSSRSSGPAAMLSTRRAPCRAQTTYITWPSAVEHFGPVNVPLNTAVIETGQPLLTATETDFDKVVATSGAGTI